MSKYANDGVVFRSILKAAATQRWYTLVATAGFGLFAGHGFSSVFTCNEGFQIDIATPGPVSTTLQNGDEIRCSVNTDRFDCGIWSRRDSSEWRELSAVVLSAGSSFVSNGMIGCSQSNGTFLPRRDYACTITDVTTGEELNHFALRSFGGTVSTQVDDHVVTCGELPFFTGCTKGTMAGFSGEFFDGFLEKHVAVGTEAFGFREQIGSRYLSYACSSSGASVRQPEPAAPVTGTWTERADLAPTGQLASAEADFVEGSLSVYTNGTTPWRSFRYDEDFGSWGELNPLALPPGARLLKLANGNRVAFTGSGESFLVTGDMLGTRPLARLNSPEALRYRWDLASVAAIGNNIVFWGGLAIDPSGFETRETNQGWILDPIANSWRVMATTGAPSPRRHATAIAISDEEVFIWGGGSGNSPANAAKLGDGGIYNLATGLWRPVNTAGAHPAVAFHPETGNIRTASAYAAWTGTEVLIWGGWNPDEGYVTRGHLYNPSTDTWRPMTPGGPANYVIGAVSMMTPMGFLLWGSMDLDQTFMHEGQGWLYDTIAEQWSRIAPVDSGFAQGDRRYAVATAGDGIFLIGASPVSPDAAIRTRVLRP